jgi:hypothetical protein
MELSRNRLMTALYAQLSLVMELERWAGRLIVEENLLGPFWTTFIRLKVMLERLQFFCFSSLIRSSRGPRSRYPALLTFILC